MVHSRRAERNRRLWHSAIVSTTTSQTTPKNSRLRSLVDAFWGSITDLADEVFR